MQDKIIIKYFRGKNEKFEKLVGLKHDQELGNNVQTRTMITEMVLKHELNVMFYKGSNYWNKWKESDKLVAFIDDHRFTQR